MHMMTYFGFPGATQKKKKKEYDETKTHIYYFGNIKKRRHNIKYYHQII